MSNINTTTCLMICGTNLNAILISDMLGFKDTTITRQGEIVLPTIVEGASRSYDHRMGLDCWKKGLTSKQHKFDIETQLGFWVELLYPVRDVFQEFKALEYWSVIDCQIASIDLKLPSVQFRLPQTLRFQLSQIELDIDFTIYRPVT
jgi:hypothetical protein